MYIDQLVERLSELEPVKAAIEESTGAILRMYADGDKLAEICDIAIIAPSSETYRVQEYHLPIYHAICAQVEHDLFAE